MSHNTVTLPAYPDPDCVAAVALLKPRERDALVLAGKGLRGSEVAARMHVAPATLANIMSKARKKLTCQNTPEACVMLAKAGLL